MNQLNENHFLIYIYFLTVQKVVSRQEVLGNQKKKPVKVSAKFKIPAKKKIII